MHRLRIAFHTVLALALFAGGLYLFTQDSLFVSDRWNPAQGSLFQGATLYGLACGLLLLGAFSAAVAWAWARGRLPLPGQDNAASGADLRGMALLRFWYLALPALGLIAWALLAAEKVPNPALQRPQPSTATPTAVNTLPR